MCVLVHVCVSKHECLIVVDRIIVEIRLQGDTIVTLNGVEKSFVAVLTSKMNSVVRSIINL